MSCFEIQYLVTQYGLLAATCLFYGQLLRNEKRRERQALDSYIKTWCKAVFRQGSGSPGTLQRAGEKVRKRYPKRMNLILTAYDEQLVEEPGLKLPPMHKFLESMEGVEQGLWPSWTDADKFVGKD